MDKQIAQLETMLRDEAAAHERMLSLLDGKLEAIRLADQAKTAEALGRENEQLQRIGELAKRRLEAVAALTLRVEPAAAAPMTLGELAERLDEPARGRLLVLRQQLREVMQQVRERSGSMRRASELLLGHMQGLMRTVTTAVSGGGMYGRSGTPPRGAMAVSTLSVTA